MRVVLQKVKHASVEVEKEIVGKIDQGYLVFLGIHKDDTEKEISTMIKKISEARIAPNKEESKDFDISLQEAKVPLLVISQFTLYGDLNRGRRPSFDLAARPDTARGIYDHFITTLKKTYPGQIETGIFQAHMFVSSVNEGPVTFIYDTSSL